MSFHSKIQVLGFFSLVLFIGCQSPVEVEDPSADLIERESVWQYVKAWSIYQGAGMYAGRIPSDPFSFPDGSSILRAIGDTLDHHTDSHGNRIPIHYTRYLTPEEKTEIQFSSSAAAATGLRSSVFLDTLTDSTACVTILQFTSTTWSDFRFLIPILESFPNIIFDVRGNPGGFIEPTDSIIASVVPEGTAYLWARQREHDEAEDTYETIDWHHWETTKAPVLKGAGEKRYALLQEGRSASASEILAAGLYEGRGALILGDTSYGKGIGQVILPRRTRLWMEVTYLQMRGISERIGDYHRRGIVPDVVPAAIRVEGESLASAWQRDIFHAVKMLEPSVGIADIRYPPNRMKSSSKTLGKLGCYRIVPEEQ